jgi:hypothetical protein
MSNRPPGPESLPPKRESTSLPAGSVTVDDIDWLLSKAELALELDVFCTVQADHDRLKSITERVHTE